MCFLRPMAGRKKCSFGLEALGSWEETFEGRTWRKKYCFREVEPDQTCHVSLESDLPRGCAWQRVGSQSLRVSPKSSISRGYKKVAFQMWEVEPWFRLLESSHFWLFLL